MSCLLCLTEFSGDDPAKSRNNDAAPRKIRISTLCQLLLASRPRNCTIYDENVTSQLAEDDDTCEFCPSCGPVMTEVEEIRDQMALLEGQIRTKFAQIRATITSSLHNEGQDKISKIRDIILRVTDGINNQRNGNFALDEFEVKIEQVEFHDHETVIDEELLSSYHHPYDLTNPEVDSDEENDLKMDPLQLDDDDDDSAFCIIPCSQKKQKSTQAKTQKSTKPRSKPARKDQIKRKREISLAKKPEKTTPPIKCVKLEPRPNLERTRPSPRIKPQAQPPKEPITKEKVSSTRSIPHVKSEPNSSNENDDWDPTDMDDTEVDKVIPSSKRYPLPLKCTSCAKSFSTESMLTRHMARDHRYHCHVCPVKLRRSHALTAHMRQVHPGILAYPCSLCDKKFKSSKARAAHMITRHEEGEKKFPCAKCDKRFCRVENLERHLELHEVEGVKPIVCDVCDDRFEDDERLRKHMDRHNAVTCHLCGVVCTTKWGMDRHMRIHTGEKPEKCDQCGASFIDKTSLKNHIAKEHSSKKHVCHICGRGFYLPVSLRRHIDLHEGRFPYECEPCGEKFRMNSTFQSHKVKVHGADPFVCDVCGSTFTCAKRLREHKLTHGGIKRHQCEERNVCSHFSILSTITQICGACFLRKFQLDAHLRVHTNERPFPCPHCDKAFKQSKALTVHVLRLHTPGYVAPIRYPCPHCDKGYTHNHYLQAHIRQVHTGERPFVCDQIGCGKGFAKKTSLYLHLKGHHGLIMEKKIDRLPPGKRRFPRRT
ncbi:zinc finger protein 846 isoform X2 [Folsomia candida]|uniref:zinc finger protein 846 isoform X2 n=1 Tax=Folsomia candida TaxID=158441 RepID=UPI001604CD41|nr:zinc finger protein 846 isoform X2 [Folsomia candida]